MGIQEAAKAMHATLDAVTAAYWAATGDGQTALAKLRDDTFKAYTALVQENLKAGTPEFAAAVAAAKDSVEAIRKIADHVDKLIADADKAASLLNSASKAMSLLSAL